MIALAEVAGRHCAEDADEGEGERRDLRAGGRRRKLAEQMQAGQRDGNLCCGYERFKDQG